MLIAVIDKVYKESELEKLEQKLKQKHRVALLLDVLQKKESIRVRRFEEITNVLNTLRYVFRSCNQRQ